MEVPSQLQKRGEDEEEEEQKRLKQTLLKCSALIDQENAIISSLSLPPKRFTGWEPICEIFVSNNHSLILPHNNSNNSVGKKRDAKDEYIYDSSDDYPSDRSFTPPQTSQALPPGENINNNNNNEKKIDLKKTKLKRPSSSTRVHILPLSPSSSHPSQTYSSPPSHPPSSNSPVGFLPHIGSGSNLRVDDEKKDFLPKIDVRHSSRKVSILYFI